MITDLLKWVAPGLFGVLGGAALAVFVAPGASAIAFELPAHPAVGAHGAPAIQTAQAIIQAPALSSSITVLPAPRISDYWVSATRQPGGVVVFDGYVPNDATRQALSATEGADTSYLKLGSGEPAAYQSALDFGVAALAHLSEGRFALRTNIVTLSGIAASSDDYKALAGMSSAGLPQGLVLARNEITPPTVSSFTWAASKSADGKLAFSGMLPSADIGTQLTAAAGGATSAQAMTYASGAPADFASSALAGLALMGHLETGKLSFDGVAWSLTGKAGTEADKTAITTEFANGKLAAANWTVTVKAPAVAVAPTTPYVWSAARADDGTITFSGLVPTDGLKQFAALRAGDKLVDGTSIDATAPEGFVQNVLAALDALALLDQGTIAFDGKNWSVSGATPAGGSAAAVTAALSIAATPSDQWQVAVTAPAPAAEPVVTAEAPAGAEPAAPPQQTPSAEPATPPAPAAPVIDPAYAFTASRIAGAAIAMTGQVPADAAQRYFGVVANAPTTGLAVAEGAPADFIPSAVAGLRALSTMNDGTLTFAGGKWSLAGKAADTASRDTLLADIAALPAGANWSLDIATPPALEACQTSLAAFSARNAILFQSGAAVIAAESEPALDELAQDLGACPDAVVNIEGYTDADGDEQLNLALSVARAEAVVNALAARSVVAERLYAIGYGESNPIADNGTAAGKRLNRRIVISVSNDDY